MAQMLVCLNLTSTIREDAFSERSLAFVYSYQ